MSFSSLLNSTIKSYTFTEGAGPTFVKTWVFAENLDAAVHQLSGNERVVDIGKQVFADIRIFVETSTGVEGTRIKFNSKIYEIVHIDDPMGRGHHVEYKCAWLPKEDISDYPDS